jgi:two-component system cell cycle response regulator
MKVLVAEDDRTSRVLLTRTLERWGYQVVAVEDGELAWEEMTRSAPRMLISDWEMPRLDGPSLCRRIKQRPAGAPYVFALLLTQHSDVERIVEGLNAGADDFVTKPFVPAELRARLGVGRRFLALQDELAEGYRQIQRANEQLSRIAATDPLMNIGNRRRFDSAMADLHERGTRPYGFFMVDIDHFKSVNDRHGHAVGDRVLAAVAQAVQAALGAEGEAFRYGGEEIAVVVPSLGG